RWRERLEGHLELLRCYYNFVRPHRALKFGREIRTPAMQAGLKGKRLTLRKIFCSGIVLLASCEFVLVFVYSAPYHFLLRMRASGGLATFDGGSTLEMQLSPKTQQAPLEHLRRLVERRPKRLVLLDHYMRVQAVKQVRLRLPEAVFAKSELFRQPEIQLVP